MKNSLVFGLATLLVFMVAVDTVSAQGRGGRGGRGGFGAFGGQNNNLGLLMNRQIQEELELVDDQIDELREVQQRSGEIMREAFSGIDWRNMDADEREEAMAEVREKMEEDMKDLQKDVDEILLPHQRTRLKQIAIQSQSRGRNGVAGALGSDAVAKELGLSEEDVKELEEKNQEVQEKLREKIAKLQKEAEEEVLSVLSSEQRKKYKEMVGDKFEFQNFGGQRGQRGQRGQGGRGGRGGGGGN